jgi:hypothetical protein
MLNELKKSISATLYERTTSPLFGTLAISWSIWNWKILYLTFFISENKIIGKNKIEYIIEHYYNECTVYYYPILSTIILITLVPFLSNGAYWMSIKFLKWKKDIKNEIEKNQLLSIEQSTQLREQIANQELRFLNLIDNKNLEIKQLNLTIDGLKGSKNNTQNESIDSGNTELKELVKRIKENHQEESQFNTIIKLIQSGFPLRTENGADSKFVSLLESYEIIKPLGKGVYELTTNGRKLNRLIDNPNSFQK